MSRRFDLSLRGRKQVTGEPMDADELREVAAQMRDDANMMIDRIRTQYWGPLVQDAVATLLHNTAEAPHPDVVKVAAAYRGERPPVCSAVIVHLEGDEGTESPCTLSEGHGERHTP